MSDQVADPGAPKAIKSISKGQKQKAKTRRIVLVPLEDGEVIVLDAESMYQMILRAPLETTVPDDGTVGWCDFSGD